MLHRLLALSQPALPPRKQVQLPPQAAPVRQDLGTHLDNLMVPKATGSLGSPLTTTETQDADLILSQVLRMNMHEVSSYYSFHVNNSTLECLFRLIKSGKGQTYQLSTGPSEFIATQVPYPPNSYSKQESNVNTLRPGTRMTYPLRSWKPIFANSSTNITVRQSKRNWKTICASLESFGPKATRILSRTLC